jgi:ureidoacrylate peracid hydrolase
MNSAVVVVDMQNGFIHPEGSFPRVGISQPGIPEVLAANIELVAAARERGIPVIFTRHVFRPDMADLPAKMGSLLPPGIELLQRGSWDAEIHDDLTPDAGDLVIDKNRFDAFLYTDLELQLRAMSVRRLLVTGVVTSVCVESTVRSGNQRDFDMLVASDCVAAPESQQQASLDTMGAVFAAVGPWKNCLETLSSGSPE